MTKTKLNQSDIKYLKDKFEKSLFDIAKFYKKYYKKYREYYKKGNLAYFSEDFFKALTFHFLVKKIKNKELIFFVRCEELSIVSKKRHKKKLDLGILTNVAGKRYDLVVCTEFKYQNSGGIDLANIGKLFKNDLKKLKKEKSDCDKYFVFIHGSIQKEKTQKSKDDQLKRFRKKYNQKIKFFYIAPEFSLFLDKNKSKPKRIM